ncbi:phage protein Gp36 family protein [Chryseobacterium koreense]|uniref:DUF1320 domain-containing protein n=1 Tax=Chryseobacterium koreense CCUG 49689 TaxID=1304281 RepID=A0A0J7IVC4_9FLAO|nr:phage protein Gp36 family protein [Chryseobacterium koreense]KMQ70233.1 hypothetical protein ACM44_13335 [Chryseobacterium koreense CCUG 49689]MBB5334731.1 hypothetical protein [Chryseobacterium koreense]
MFLEIHDLGTTIYNYQIDQITENNEDITIQGIAAAEEELRSYLAAPEWSDGRPKYDVDAILTAKDNDRNQLLVRICSTLAKFYIIELCNADIIYEIAKERYDRALDWLKKFAKGELKLTLAMTPEIDPYDDGTQPFIYGSREKFNHE